MAEQREFPTAAVLTVTTGKMFVPGKDIRHLYALLGFMTTDTLWTHQLPRACRECRPWLFRQHPQLADVDAFNVSRENWEPWLAEQIERLGEMLTVERIPADDHDRIDPWTELVAMRGTDEGIVPVVLANRDVGS